MEHKLLQNITEYRNWAWNYYEQNWNHNNKAAEALGLSPIFDCWDSVLNENGELVDVDEDGNVIPEDSAETIKLQEWMSEVEFPAVVAYWFEDGYSRNVRGKDEIYICDFVSLSEFSQ